MRKLMSKKGFTLVELMIVVVILGILVAVAVPIFGAVTKNARIKSCKSNQRVIKGNLETYMTTGNNGDAITFAASTTADYKSNADFLKLFDGAALPVCPSKAAGDTDSYNAKVSFDATAGTTSYITTCATAAGATEGHNG